MKKILNISFIFIALATLAGCSSPKRFADNHFEEAIEAIFENWDVSSDDVEIHEVEYYGSIIDLNIDEQNTPSFRANSYVRFTVVVYYVNMTIENEDYEVLYMYMLAEDEDGKTDFDKYFEFSSKAEFDDLVETYDKELEEDLERSNIDNYRSSTGSIRSGVANRTLNRVLD